jgi:hypothetical protein
MPIRLFKNESHIHTRALQIYLVLIGVASNKTTIPFGKLSKEQMGGYGGGHVIVSELKCVEMWCASNNLPDLTTLVVNAQTGLPTGKNTEQAQEAQGQVYACNWFDFFPPSADELKALNSP